MHWEKNDVCCSYVEYKSELFNTIGRGIPIDTMIIFSNLAVNVVANRSSHKSRQNAGSKLDQMPGHLIPSTHPVFLFGELNITGPACGDEDQKSWGSKLNVDASIVRTRIRAQWSTESVAMESRQNIYITAPARYVLLEHMIYSFVPGVCLTFFLYCFLDINGTGHTTDTASPLQVFTML